jgi:hypothetical protein
MADQTTVHMGENSPEQVAYKLMGIIAQAEKVNLTGVSVNSNRQWILKTYMQCLVAVRTPHYPDDVLKMHEG